MISSSFDSSYWVEGFLHENSKDSHGFWVPTDIDLEFISIEEDTLPFIYSNSFKSFRHFNYYTRDKEHGPLVVSIKMDLIDGKKQYTVLIRLVGGTLYKVISEDFLTSLPTPEQIVDGIEPRLNIKNLQRVLLPNAIDYINRFDMHTINYQHKIGILYQKLGQTTEEDILGNQTPSRNFAEFLKFLGECVSLKDFSGFAGGLDTKHDLTGTKSIYTTFQGREIMFHISTMLPFDDSDYQQIQRKRHIGNDIVAIVFQDEGSIYIPGTFKSHFLMVIFVLQPVKDAYNHTLYKVSLIANDDCANFNPLLPHPPVYLSGEEFRIFLFTKLINAELSVMKSPKLLLLDCRTRTQLLENLLEKFESKSFPNIESNSGLFSVENRGYSNSLRRKLNTIFSARKHFSGDINAHTNVKSTPYPYLDFNIDTLQKDLSKTQNKCLPEQNNKMRSNKLNKSEPPSIKYACHLPLRGFPPDHLKNSLILGSSIYHFKKDSDPNNLFCNGIIPHFDGSKPRCGNSRNFHFSLDENSFTSLVFDSLPQETALQCKSSLGFSDLPISHSSEIQISSKKPEDIDHSFNFETTNFNPVNTLNSPHQHCSRNSGESSFVHFRSKSLVIPRNHRVESVDVNIDLDNPLLKQQLLQVQNLNRDLNLENQLIRNQVIRLKQNNADLIYINNDLISKLDKKSLEIEELNLDLHLFAYFQSNS